MYIINTVIGIPLGYVMFFCYKLTGNYGMAVILFTILSKVILFPVSLVVQKNSIKMAKLKPMLEEVQARYAGDKDKIAEEQIKLYDNEKYSPAMGCLPTLLQLPLILGVINVVYNPLQHLLHITGDTTEILASRTAELLGTMDLGYGAQLKVIDAIKQNPGAFEGLGASLPDFDAVLAAVRNLDLNFMAIDLSATPSAARPDILIWIPVLSGLSALLMCVAQNKMNVLQREQSALSQWGATAFLVAFSTYFPFIVPCGVGLYWIAGNVASIPVMALCNAVYNPRVYIDYENRPQKVRLSKEERLNKKVRDKQNRMREKADVKRFYADDNIRRLVFYSAQSGFYKYFKNCIDYITDNSDITVHYVTSDPDDIAFKLDNPQILPYYVGGRALIPFMMKMDADMVVMTMPDLNQYHIKRSLVRKDVEYVYTDHGMTSLHMMLREGALDYYDTIFCVGPNHIREVRETEKAYGLPEKTLVKVGYGVLDDMLEAVAKMDMPQNTVKTILIAPSWQKDNILELCIDEILNQIAGKGYRVIVRPHPEFVRRFPAKINRLKEKYMPVMDDNFVIETDFSSNETVFLSDLVITDWSSIAQEFSYATLKPSLFINTPMKIMNPEYKKIPCVPLDISLRNEIGAAVDVDRLDTLKTVIDGLFSRQGEYREKIAGIVKENVYNIGHSGEAGGQYIIDRIKKAQREDGEE